MAIRRPPTTFSDTISTADIADDAITGGKLANDIAISTTGNIVTTGSGALTVAGNTTLSGTNNLGSNPTVTLGSNATLPGYTGGNFRAVYEYENQSNYASGQSAGSCINAYHTFRGTSSIRQSQTPTTDGVYIVVTPKSASSKFLLMHCGYGYYDSGSDGTVYLKVFRHINASPSRSSATDISENFSSATGTAYHASVMNGYLYNLTYNDFTFKLDWNGIDAPNTTTKIGYYFETTSDGVQYRYPQGRSYLTILELAG